MNLPFELGDFEVSVSHEDTAEEYALRKAALHAHSVAMLDRFVRDSTVLLSRPDIPSRTAS